MIPVQNRRMALAALAAGLVWVGGTIAGRAADGLDARVINIDFNGAQNFQGPRGPGPTYAGQGAAGGGSVWNGIVADARIPDGLDNQNIISISAKDLVNSGGTPTSVRIVIGPVGGDCPNAGSDPAAPEALFGDYAYVGNAGQATQQADFTISGLGPVPSVDLYFYYGYNGNITVTGAASAAFTSSGIFTPDNTIYFPNVPVTNGTVTGAVGNGSSLIVLDGITIQMAEPSPQPVIQSAEPRGPAVGADTPITIELQDNATQVVSDSVQLLVNGEAVVPQISKPQGSTITTVAYNPNGGWAGGSTNTFVITFSDNSTPPVVQTGEFAFSVLDEKVAGVTVNIDCTGAQNTPITREPGPLFVGVGAAGGGTTWNAVLADSRVGDGSDDRNLALSAENLVNSLGQATSVGFAIGPVAGDTPNGGDAPDTAAALFGDFIYVGSSEQSANTAEFTLSGLGETPFVILHFYYGAQERADTAGIIAIPGSAPAPFGVSGVYTDANTRYFPRVWVTDGTVTGTMGNGPLTLLYGLTIQEALPQPFIRSAAPTGGGTRPDATITVELEDYVAQLVPSSVQLLVNGQAVQATVNKPAGSAITTVSYRSEAGWPAGSTNAFRVIFDDDASPPVRQVHDFAFVVLNEASASTTINIDFNGAQNQPARGPGPTYVGQSAAGGGNIWNGVLVDSRLPDGLDDHNLTVTANDLVNSIGDATSVDFTISPVGGDCPAAGTDPTDSAALFGDYLYVGSGGQISGRADFTISGLGAAPYVDIFFCYGANDNFVVPDGTRATFAGNGIFTPGNIAHYAKVAVADGTVTGTVGTGSLTILHGMTVQLPLPQPFVRSVAPTGQAVRVDTPITIQLEDYVTEVLPSSVQLEVNGQVVEATVNKPAGSAITTVTYSAAGGWAQGSANTFQIAFGDNATPSVVQTYEYAFNAMNEVLAAATINIDFTGIQNTDWGSATGGRGPGPTYIGPGAAGSGTVWNGIIADQRLSDGTDDRNIIVSSNNLVNSLGEVTTVSFTIGPVSADDPAGGEDPTVATALFGDYLYVGYGGQTTGMADFAISGLGETPYVDLYFYWSYSGNFVVPGGTATPFVAQGIFSPGNTVHFTNVPVTIGTVTGTMGTGSLTALNGMTIQKSAPQAGSLSIALEGGSVVISWTGAGTLQAADQVTGTWADVLGATSPNTIAPVERQRFYRLRQ